MKKTARTSVNPHPSEFDRFLQASVGEDRAGNGVTVLSLLARLGFDPWNETAELVLLGREAARARLANLLSRFRDVPSLASDYGRVARDLSLLLPERPMGRSVPAGGGVRRVGTSVSGTVLTIFALAVVLLQILFVFVTGAGKGK